MAQRLAKRLLLIGWDAADWRMLDPIMNAGGMPCLKAFLDQGVRGNIATLHPIISPILWNSIATGKRADKHDILGFVEPDGQGYIRPVSSTSRRAKAVWNILSQHGLRSTVVGWYASYPAEPINGCIVTDRYEHASPTPEGPVVLDERAIHPASLFQTLVDLRVGINDITGEQAQVFVPTIDEIDPAQDRHPEALATLLSQCATVHNAATWLIENEPWDFMAVYYDSIDHFGHGFMEFHPPKMEHVSDEDFARYRGVMTAAYRFHDLLLARLLHLAGPDTTVILLSDHGFQNGALRPRLFIDPKTGAKSGAGANPVAWHRPQGVFAARGPGIRRGQEINGASLLDVCPTILTLLGLPVADDMDGAPLVQIFEHRPEIARIPSYEPPHPKDGVHRGAAHDDPYSSHEALHQLVELGYLAPITEDKAAMVANTIRDRRKCLAQVHFSAGRYTEAEAILRELVEQTPVPEFKTRLAMCLISLRRFEEVEPVLADLAGDATEAPVATLLAAQARFGQGRYDQAAELLERVIRFGVKFAQMHTLMGQVRSRQQRWEESEASFRSALEEDPDDAPAHDGLGVALRQTGRAEEAVYEHMKSVALAHNVADSHINLGVALADCKKIDWAIRAFETAAELAPEKPFPHRCLSQLYRRAKKDPDKARMHMRRALELRAKVHDRAREEFLRRPSW